jgi:polar amino acid transport system ATP-binding protein/sulfate transport system ATP-binding protein/NitT/TauT family transport system ATP-binding protein
MIDKVTELLIRVSLTKEVKTLIIISHDLPNSLAISDTVFVLGREEGKPGATIKHTVDMMERNLAWRRDVKEDPAFISTLAEVKKYL